MDRALKGLLAVLLICAVVYAAVRVAQTRRAAAPEAQAQPAAETAGLEEGKPRAAALPPMHLIRGEQKKKPIEGHVPAPAPAKDGR